MGFLDNLSKKVSETTSSFQEATNKIERQNKCKRKIETNNIEIGKIYKAIGEKVYKAEKSDKELEKFICDNKKVLDSLLKENEDLNMEILTLNNKKLCSNCGAEIDITTMFCPKCGKEQEKVEDIVPQGKKKCSNCQKIIEDSDVFCPNCGAKNEEIHDDVAKVVEVDEMAEADEEKKIEE